MAKTLLFSITRDDCDWQTFASGGPGGQHQNKTESGVRVVHRASGAVGESREHRSQHQNKQAAFSRMVQTPRFLAWHKLEVSRRLGSAEPPEAIERRVDAFIEQVRESIGDLPLESHRVEYYDGARWRTVWP